MVNVQALLSTYRTGIFLGVYGLCIVPWSIILIALAGVFYNQCTPVSNWGIIYGIFTLIAPLLMLPPMIYLSMKTKVYSTIVTVLISLAYTALFISGLVVPFMNIKHRGCMTGGGLALWIISLLTVLLGLVSTASSAVNLYSVWKSSEDRSTVGAYESAT